MKRSTSLLFVIVATLGLSATSNVFAKPASTPPTVFTVFLTDQSCSVTGCKVVVTAQSTWKGSSVFDTCTKNPANTNECLSTGNYGPGKPDYEREKVGDPWFIE